MYHQATHSTVQYSVRRLVSIRILQFFNHSSVSTTVGDLYGVSTGIARVGDCPDSCH